VSTIEIRVTESVTVANFTESVANGNVQFYRVRGNGTTRHIPVFAQGTPEFETAEQVAEWREDGKTMKDIAAELHMSVPSVRRLLNSYLLSDEVAEYDEEEIAEILADAQEGDGTDATEILPAEEPEEEDGELGDTNIDGVTDPVA
jgi:hypothetical protein